MDDHTRHLTGLVVGACIFLVIGVGLLRFMRARSDAILRKWADEGEFEILQRNQEFIGGGPFKWTNRNQTVFFLRVRGRNGCERSCWARCGGNLSGVFFSDAIEIIWDEP
jgi:hypothetical protein